MDILTLKPILENVFTDLIVHELIEYIEIKKYEFETHLKFDTPIIFIGGNRVKNTLFKILSEKIVEIGGDIIDTPIIDYFKITKFKNYKRCIFKNIKMINLKYKVRMVAKLSNCEKNMDLNIYIEKLNN